MITLHVGIMPVTRAARIDGRTAADYGFDLTDQLGLDPGMREAAYIDGTWSEWGPEDPGECWYNGVHVALDLTAMPDRARLSALRTRLQTLIPRGARVVDLALVTPFTDHSIKTHVIDWTFPDLVYIIATDKASVLDNERATA
jgi:hypothetical protein